ncbi:hypothetical protein [Natrinema marinum]|uniref:hypothetical protein n=1 Tax=Natrinema marinum TaxID=2961598 RepID=UPI0020C8874A|nr:hypothetical protein [Natrinema marinum]
MSDDRLADGQRDGSLWQRARSRAVATTAGRLLADLVVVACWVLLLTLLSLSANWSRAQFYALLFLGVVAYVLVTAPWGR